MTRQAVVFTALTGLLLVPSVYAVLRGYDVLFTHEPHPSTVGPSEHIAMFWRINIGVYVALATAPLLYRVALAAPERYARGLGVGLFVAVTLITVQGIFLP